jgi:hypothetical protein
MIQTGVQSTLSFLHAFRYLSARDINDDLLNKLTGVYKPDGAKKIEINCVTEGSSKRLPAGYMRRNAHAGPVIPSQSQVN